MMALLTDKLSLYASLLATLPLYLQSTRYVLMLFSSEAGPAAENQNDPACRRLAHGSDFDKNSPASCKDRYRKLVPGSPIKNATCALLVHPAPLLEMKSDTVSGALISERADPFRVHLPRARTTLSSCNRPVNFIQIDLIRGLRGAAQDSGT